MENQIENTSLGYEPEILKQHIKIEMTDYGAICLDCNELENTFDQEEFENWLKENNWGYYESYTIYRKE